MVWVELGLGGVSTLLVGEQGEGSLAGRLKLWGPPRALLLSALPEVSLSWCGDTEAFRWQKHEAKCQGTWTLGNFCH